MRRRIYNVCLLLIIIILLSVVKLPYYVTYPGEAEPLDEMVRVEDGNHEGGSLMLTTIRMGKANVVQYVAAHFSKYQLVFPESQIKREWESEQEFDHRQLKIMEGSQQTSTIVAYKLANEKIEIKNKGAIVAGLIEEMPAAKELLVGDVIIAVNHQKIEKAEELLDYLKGKEKGEEIHLAIERNGVMREVDLTIEQFPEQLSENGEILYGVGIVGPVTKRVIETERKIQFDTNNIGGPSAGLMFALEIYNQLTKDDITKGHNIAGTGEIFEDGTVGAIGGIEQKIVAADKAGTEFFFAPIAGENFEVAKKAAADIKTKMHIVPVQTIDDALEFLKTL